MNPDKLFDYLDGKLSPADRDDLEKKLATDSQLLRQLAVAREIHRNMRGSREVIVPDPTLAERSGRMGRRIATAAIALVALNVFVGIAVIAAKNKKPAGQSTQEAAIRQQLAASLGAAGANALPAPSFVEDELRITAPRGEWDAVAERVSATADGYGGSAAKGLAEEESLTVMVDIPSTRSGEFRQAVLPVTPVSPAASPGATTGPVQNERTIVRVRIAETAR